MRPCSECQWSTRCSWCERPPWRVHDLRAEIQAIATTWRVASTDMYAEALPRIEEATVYAGCATELRRLLAAYDGAE